jgi:hypothetical protein
MLVFVVLVGIAVAASVRAVIQHSLTAQSSSIPELSETADGPPDSFESGRVGETALTSKLLR